MVPARILAVCIPALLWWAAYRRARRTIIHRRVWLKEQFTGPEDILPQLTPGEERLVVLLGRIKGQRAPAALYAWAAILAVVAPRLGPIRFSQPLRFAILVGAFALIQTLRLLYHSARAATAVPRDADRARPGVSGSTASGRYLVDIDIGAVHDFNLPPKAQPFWSVEEVPRWLRSFGFRRIDLGHWVASERSLRHLHGREIRSLKQLDGEPTRG